MLIWTLIFSAFAFGQNVGKSDTAVKVTEVGQAFATFLTEIPATAAASTGYAKESEAMASVLIATNSKSAVLIDDLGFAREMVLGAVAAKLASSGKRLVRINWNAIFAAAKDDKDLGRIINGVLSSSVANRDNTTIYLDDIASFSKDAPMFGSVSAAAIYRSLEAGTIQVMSAAEATTFEQQIAGDAKMRNRFARIAVAKENEDSFVGDKLSPDLRALVAGADQNRTVKVILQSDDIDNPQLQNVLKRNGVVIADRIEALDMLVIDLPVRVAEEVAAVQSAKHLSLDTQVQLLGHIESTTGVSQVRNQTRMALNLLGIPITTSYQLDGAGIGVAVVDSGVYEGHRSFVDSLLGDRVVKHVDFTGNTSGNATSRDPFGHGSHVAGLIGGGKGQGTELLQYRSMAPSVNLINVRVLGANGTGTSAGLLQGLEWIY
ncbi:MAG: S8 family serine peptidase, partial [Gallionella sp.]